LSTENDNLQEVRKIRFNTIWFVPLIALLIAGWMVYQNWSNQGPEVTLIAQNADGIEAGKTKVKARNVDVGMVTAVRLSDDFNQAIITVRMNKNASKMLHANAQFWVVKPRIGKAGVSGLGTLLSGAYIEMEPSLKGELKTHFSIRPNPPISTDKSQGIHLKLFGTDSSKMDVGTAVHFRGYDVGFIEKVGFDIKKNAITYQIFIRAPYDSLVNSAVHFWITPGFSLQSSARGFEVRLDSLETLLSGGISFGMLKDQHIGHPVKNLSQFELYSSKQAAQNHVYNEFINYLFLFKENISGLEVGAPVEYRGLRIGTVMQVPYDGLDIRALTSMTDPVVPVLARIEPQRLDHQLNGMSRQEFKRVLEKSIHEGLRASLKTSNLLTGAKIIDLNIVANAQPIKNKILNGIDVFPTTPNSLANIETKVSIVLDKLSKAPIDESFSHLNRAMVEANNTLQSIKKLTNDLNALLQKKDTQALPKQVLEAVQELKQTLVTYQSDGQIGGPAQESIESLQRSLNELQPLLRELRKDPNVLIFDKKTQPDIQPRAGTQ